ncbi:MAG TPA: MATE family efflux transporter [Oscillospiraceae bacterium]|nr:MATE family efflux transporter [Oscillospiraceae bacterium]
MVSEKDMHEGNIFKLILNFSGPAITGMLVMSVYNIVDRIYIGRGVGTLGIAGIAIGHPLMMIKGAMAMLVAIGSSAMISINLGQKKKEAAEKILGHGFTLLVVFAIFASGVSLVFLTPLMRLFGASENVLPYATDYMRVILIGNVFQMIGYGANNFIRAEGNPRTAMFSSIIGAGTNIILDPILIFVFEMGVTGAAVATIISQAASAAWVLHYYLSGKSYLKIRKINLRPELPLSLKMMSLGTSSFVRQVSNSMSIVLLNNSLQHYGGDMAVSAMGVIFSIRTLQMMPVLGISQGVQPIIGYNYGAQQLGRVKKAFKLAVLLATAATVLNFAAIMLFPEFFFRLFTTDAELIAVGAAGVRRYMLFLPILGYQVLGANYFQAVGKPKQAIFLNLSRQAIFLIPALLFLPRYFGLSGTWSAQPTADALSVLVTTALVWYEMRRLTQQDKQLQQLTN